MKKTTPKPITKINKPQQKKTLKGPALGMTDLMWLLGLFILLFIVYFPTLSKEFIAYDDGLYIQDCPDIKYFTFSRIPSIFSHFYMAQYSPLPTITCGIIHSISGFKPFLFNLSGMFLHIINTGLVFFFVWQLCKKFPAAIITAALFALNPMQVESVAWSAAVFKTGLYTMFSLAALILYIKYVRSNKLLFMILSLLLFLCAFFSKEQSVALSVSIIAVDYFLGRNLLSKKVILEKIPYLLVSILIGLVALASTKTYHENLASTPFSMLDRLMYASFGLMNYVAKLFIPYNLSIYHPYLKIKGLLFYISPLIIVISLALLYIFFKKKNRFVLFGMLLFFINISFSLILNFLAARGTMMADRYVYFASIGFYFIIGTVFTDLFEKKKVSVILLASGMAVYIGFMSIYSYNRTFIYKNTGTVMTDVIEKYPGSSFPYVNRGIFLRKNGQEAEALQDYNTAIAIDPRDDNAILNRGNIYFDRGMDSLALLDYNKSLSINPNPKGPELFSNRGAILSRMKRYDEALLDYDKSIKIDPYFITAYLNRGVTYNMMKEYELGIKEFNYYLKLNPGHVGVYNDLGVLKQSLNRHKEAINDFSTAIRMKPNEGLYYMNRAISYYNLGDKENARKDVQTAEQYGQKTNPVFSKLLNTGK